MSTFDRYRNTLHLPKKCVAKLNRLGNSSSHQLIFSRCQWMWHDTFDLWRSFHLHQYWRKLHLHMRGRIWNGQWNLCWWVFFPLVLIKTSLNSSDSIKLIALFWKSMIGLNEHFCYLFYFYCVLLLPTTANKVLIKLHILNKLYQC